jgi:mannose-1-phosphate guanylyltransferase
VIEFGNTFGEGHALMKAIILVGGKATRLLPLTVNTPKSLVPVINIPFMEHVISHLREDGIVDIVLAQGHLSKAIEDHLGDGSRFGVSIHHSYEEVPLGSAGAVKNAEKYLDSTFLVLNADIFSDLDFGAMLAVHREKKAKVTIAVTPVDDPTRYGLVESDNLGRVKRFLEKPKREEATTNMINAGAWFVETDILSRIPLETNFSFERNVFPQLLADGEPVYAYPVEGYWIDMGTIETYLQMHRELLSGKCQRCRLPGGWPVSLGEGSRIHPEARIKGPVVFGPGCSVGAKTRIFGPTVIGPNSAIEDGCTVEGSVIWRNARIESGVVITASVVADDCLLEAGSVLEGAVLGDRAVVASGARVPPGARLEPASRFEHA